MFQENITKEELDTLPLKAFDGKISVIDDEKSYKQAIEELKNESIIGFDTETKPSFKRGQINKVALLQLSTDRKAYLFRINKIGLPNEIKNILADPDVFKIGVAIRDDIKTLQRVNQFAPAGFVELQEEVKEYGIHDFSLKKIAGIVLGVRISKSQRLSNWENVELSEAQQSYAATDAWIPFLVFRSLAEA